MAQLDGARVQRRFARARRQPDFFSEELAQRLMQRLDVMRLAPARVLDLGCGVGRDVMTLRARWPQAQVCGADFALPPLRQAASGARRGWRRWWPQAAGVPLWCGARAEQLPFADACFDVVWANGLLHWLADVPAALAEIRRVLAPDGLFLFATLGPDTLREVRALAPARVHAFWDMHDLGDALLAAGLQAPVMEMEMLTLRYTCAADLWRDLRAGGAGNARADAPQHLGHRGALHDLARALEAGRGDDGRFAVRAELVFGHAWGGEGNAPRNAPGTPQVMRFFAPPDKGAA